MQLAPLYPRLYPILKTIFPQCLWTGNENLPEIALTFDDGPHPVHTPQLLQVLEQYQIKATFFWLGVNVEKFPEIAREVYRRGHAIGLHGYQHISFPTLNAIQLKESLEKTQEAITKACKINGNLIKNVRPPNGLVMPETINLLKQWDYRIIMWSVVPEDWVKPGVSLVKNRVLQQTRNGSIIVLHDGYHGGEDVASSVAEILPKLIEKGYKFITIDPIK
jgi:peptidoglycan/xylan/chitin deacetylase (PgdA/CDA1 family)